MPTNDPLGIIPSGGSMSQFNATGGVNGINVYSPGIDLSATGQGYYDKSKGWLNSDGTPQVQDPTKFNPFTMGYMQTIANPNYQANNNTPTYDPNSHTYKQAPGGTPDQSPTMQQWTPYSKYLPDKIIPSQFTQTPGQTVGNAQFFSNGQTATQGQSTLNTSSPWTASAPTSGPTTQAVVNPNQFSGFMFGNEGSLGKMSGYFSNNTPGQSTNFWQNQAIGQGQDQSNIGTFTPWSPASQGKTGASTMPVNPQISALIQSR